MLDWLIIQPIKVVLLPYIDLGLTFLLIFITPYHTHPPTLTFVCTYTYVFDLCMNRSQSNVVLTSITATNNNGQTGGAVFIRDLPSSSSPSAATLTSSTFQSNRARGNGGAIAIIASTLSATNIIFTSNRADKAGGGTYWQGGSVTCTSCTNNGNVAGGWGANQATFPFSVGTLQAPIGRQRSGGTFLPSLVGVIRDQLNQQVVDTSLIVSVSSLTYDITGLVSIACGATGNASFSIGAIGSHGTANNIQMSVSVKDFSGTSVPLSYSFGVTLDVCLPGQFVLERQCGLCTQGSYSNVIDQPACTSCETGNHLSPSPLLFHCFFVSSFTHHMRLSVCLSIYDCVCQMSQVVINHTSMQQHVSIVQLVHLAKHLVELYVQHVFVVLTHRHQVLIDVYHVYLVPLQILMVLDVYHVMLVNIPLALVHKSALFAPLANIMMLLEVPIVIFVQLADMLLLLETIIHVIHVLKDVFHHHWGLLLLMNAYDALLV
jgi:hypothetical protein